MSLKLLTLLTLGLFVPDILFAQENIENDDLKNSKLG